MANLADLTHQRASIKSSVTRFKGFVEKVTPEKIPELNNRLVIFEGMLERYEGIQNVIEQLDPGKDHTQERESFENSYFELLTKAKNLMLPATEPTHSRVGGNPGNNSGGNKTVNIKLPDITLMQYKGEYDKWSHFRDSFKTLVIDNSDLNDYQRFHYLQGSLKGEAASAIDSLEIQGSNFSEAWDILTHRFENNKQILNSHVKNIFELPILVGESYSTLRSFVDTLNKHLRALKNLNNPVDSWDLILLYLLTRKLDEKTRREWEVSTKGTISPTTVQFLEFLNNKCDLLETIEKTDSSAPITKRVPERRAVSNYLSTNQLKCIFCKQGHMIFQCQRFLSLNQASRLDEIKKLRVCINCFKPGHFNNVCRASGCRKCHKNHNSLLHRDREVQEQPTVLAAQTTPPILQADNNSSPSIPPTNQNAETSGLNAVTHTSYANHCSQDKQYILLSTAIIYIIDSNGKFVRSRALLDNGSQSNFMANDLFQKLNINSFNSSIPVSGINQTMTNVTRKTTATIKSTQNNFVRNLDFLIVDKITDNLPQISINHSKFQIPSNIKLADPEFNKSSSVDILLGASVFWDLLRLGQIKTTKNEPILQKSVLGWLISGPVPMGNLRSGNVCNLSISNYTLHNELEKFWQVEDVYESSDRYTQEEIECEEHFSQTYLRDESGRFTVSLPLRENYMCLGESLVTAIKIFKNLERRLSKDLDLKAEYSNFMSEYETLGHMTQIVETNVDSGLRYYLPHHNVIKADSLTTRLRVVFNASSKTDNGLSLNDVLKVGPSLQDHLFSIILRYRKHNVVLNADITKMYRQVKVDEGQQDLQRIVWRDDSSQPLKHFKLNTITYGTGPASFLATRCLKQLALDNKNKFPTTATIIENDFYMDDLLTGAPDIEGAIKIKRELENVLNSAGFTLRKWLSNDNRVLENSLASDNFEYLISEDNSVKTLGIRYNSKLDIFQFSVTEITDINNLQLSKRLVLSSIARIFDPLGLIGPVIMTAKIILQSLWQLGVQWDDALPPELHSRFLEFHNQLPNLEKIQIPRHVLLTAFSEIQIHGFCDASELGYGACVYIRSKNSDGVLVRLLCSKSRVAPMKTLSIPRLELCGAILLARLTNKVILSMKIEPARIVYWCDSSIVLCWLAGEPRNWNIFVGNRISEIQRTTNKSAWRHVSSLDNPADTISRGSAPDRLLLNTMWWQGPSWLSLKEDQWPPKREFKTPDIPERKPQRVMTFVSTNIGNISNIFELFSSLSKLKRVFAYCMRFIKNTSINKVCKVTGDLTNEELELAITRLSRLAQLSSFSAELKELKELNRVPKGSKISSLDPFLDENSVIRVGGRLKNSDLSLANKHPVLLPTNHPFTKLIIMHYHHKNLHAGCQSVLSDIRQEFWPMSGRRAVRNVLRKCVICFRVKPKDIVPKMGQLPRVRVQPARSFLSVGVDFAGPFMVKDGKLRNRQFIKHYISVFVCLTTRAIHFELVSDLSTDCFLNALKRFVARRGLCQKIFSDNATNFVGANNRIIKMCTFKENNKIKYFLTDNHIDWHFIPARSPHFGGIWEAAVKSTKYHLFRVGKDMKFTYEEFYTLLTEVEAILNSRPLTPLSDDPNDLSALTPGHFLIGEALNSIPQQNMMDVPFNRVTRYEHLQQMYQHFWSRWSREYLHTLQQRTKWRFNDSPEILVGALVLEKEDNVPPMQWRYARIVDVHPGLDGIIRVVSIKTSSGVVKRSVHKVCLVPLE